MITLIWGNTFIKAYKKTVKKHPILKQHILSTLTLLTANPFAQQLETHKLKGKLSGSWACSVGPDLRIVFEFVKSEKEKEESILLIEIGTHDEVY
jgi:addiction module RelE/StbE family toxin